MNKGMAADTTACINSCGVGPSALENKTALAITTDVTASADCDTN
jgi:hypothetical protein